MHPLAIITIGYVGGLLGAALSPAAPLAGAALLAAAAPALALAARAAQRRGQLRAEGLPRFLLLAAAGALCAALVPSVHRWAVPSHHLLRHVPRPRGDLIGHLSRPVERKEGRFARNPRLHIEVLRFHARGVRVPARGAVRLTLSGPLREALEVGDRIRVGRVRLRPPRGYRNPGGFDYREFLRLRSVHALAFASPEKVERLVPAERMAGWRALYAFRARMRDHLRAALPPAHAGLLEAMTLGLRESLSPEIRDTFRRAGVAHLLAISGLHVGFISMFFFFALRGIFRRLPPGVFPLAPIVLTPAKAASIAAIPIIILFTLMTGARVSTVRAAIMVVFYLLSRILERPRGALHSVLLAALFILLLEPGFIWDAGFQLSFVAVTAIILAAGRLPAPAPGQGPWRRDWWRTRFLQFAGIQGVVSFAMVPLTAWYFQQLHPIGLVTNFILIPIASLAVPLAFLVSAFGAAASRLLSAAGDALAPAHVLLRLLAGAMISVSGAASAVPGGTLTIPPPGPLLIASFLLTLACALGGWRKLWRRAGWAGAALSFLLILRPLAPAAPPPSGRTTLLLPDAFRTDAFFIRLPDGRGVAFEGGGGAGRFDTWKKVMAPLLLRQGERSWDALISLARGTLPSPAARALSRGMRLRRVLPLGAGEGRLRPVAYAPGDDAPPLWEIAGGGARLLLRPWGADLFALELHHGETRWWFALGASRTNGGAPRVRMPEGGWDLVRLPRAWLREDAALDWLERARPGLIVSAPGRAAWLPRRAWRRVRDRQRALGVHRTGWGGMLRVVTDGKRRGGAGLRIERYVRRAAWPASGRGGWEALTPPPAPRREAPETSLQASAPPEEIP
ncbi:MAG: ComEC/Rec2 family competence protein [bacterium]